MNDFLHWLRIYCHDLINKITCVIMSVDSMNTSFEKAIQDDEICELIDDVDRFFIDQLNIQTENNIYKNSIIHFTKNKWSTCKNSDDMYSCCRLLYIFQLVFLNNYNEEFVKEYFDMLQMKIEVKNDWKFSLYLAALCCIDNHNSDHLITIDSGKIFFQHEIHLEKNIIRAFVDHILHKNIVFEDKLISIY